MAAMELEWIPETLYNTAISAVVDNYSRSRRDIRSLPENIQFDVYYKVRFGGYSAPDLSDSQENARVTPVANAANCIMTIIW